MKSAPVLQILAGCGDGSIYQFDLMDMRYSPATLAALDGGISSLVSTGYASGYVAATRTGSLYRLVQQSAGQGLVHTRVVQGTPSDVTGISFAPDSRTFAACSTDGMLSLWDAEV